MRRQFPLVRADDEYTSDNLEHDFPVRIIYVLDGDGRLSRSIDGHDCLGPGWTLNRGACPG
ncbi:MAG: hypothetical protein ACKVIN_06800 [Longimicrobiales bacterium]|jgi:hypothetical protein